MINKINKWHPSSIGFVQASAVFIYCVAVGSFMSLMDGMPNPPKLLVIGTVLLLFVTSAAITGSLFLGYPLYLVLNKKIKRALSVIGFTLVFSFLFIFVAAFVFTA